MRRRYQSVYPDAAASAGGQVGGQMQLEAKIRRDALGDAATHLRLALDLLDRAGAPAQIGAHVDLAACQLESELAKPEHFATHRQAVH